MPMPPATVQRLQMNFKSLEPRIDALITRFYETLFRESPHIRSLFPADMTKQQRHMTQAILLVAKNIENLSSLREPLVAMGAGHARYGVTSEHFPIVRDAMLVALAEVSAGRWSEELHADWTRAFDTVTGYMIEGLQQQAENSAA